MRKRAEAVEATRRRITEATVELHRTVGPAATRVSDIARRAGVQRVTVYNHFPDEGSLIAACSAHWRALHPAPDPARWAGIADHGERVRAGLRALYGWYRETESMTANVLRDADLIPPLRSVVDAGLGSYLDAVVGMLVGPYRARGARREGLVTAARAAVDFHLWHALASLGDDAAAELGAALIERAAASRPLASARSGASQGRGTPSR